VSSNLAFSIKKNYYKNTKKMAQKVNSTSLRLAKKMNWNTLLCVHNFNDYYNLTNNTNLILNNQDNIIQKFNISTSIASLQKTQKLFRINYGILDLQFFLTFTHNVIYKHKTDHLNLLRQIFKCFVLNHKQIKQNVLRLNQRNVSLARLSSKFIANFIKMQDSDTNLINLGSSFKLSLQKNIVNFISLLLLYFKFNISGLKIIISGR
jgi:hypothetical protein